MSSYIVFGDLHGRILPAFRLAAAWSRAFGVRLAGALQVGDLGYFPNLARLDRATKKHAARDALELGCQQVIAFTPEADAVFADPDIPPALWFTAGNHEDYEALEDRAFAPGVSAGDFAVDLYDRVRCVRDGDVTVLPGGLRVGALWGVDNQSPSHRRNLPLRGYIRARSARDLSVKSFDVLLCHDSPPDLVFPDSGSPLIEEVLRKVPPFSQPSRSSATTILPAAPWSPRSSAPRRCFTCMAWSCAAAAPVPRSAASAS